MQRKLETAIRHAKDRQKIAKAAGDDTLRRQEQKRLNDLTRKYKDFSEKAGLSVKKDRMSVSGYHRVKPLDNGGGSGIMKADKLNDIVYSYHEITEESINNVPYVEIDGLSSEECLKLQEAHKELLRVAKSYPVGTEVSATYSMHMEKLGDTVIGERNTVSVKHFSNNYIAMHNHPSNELFSIDDIRRYLMNGPLTIFTAVGNKGKVYAIQKFDDSDVYGYDIYLSEIFDKADFDVYKYSDINNKEFDFSSVDKNKIAQTLLACMNEFFKGADKYGFKYYG